MLNNYMELEITEADDSMDDETHRISQIMLQSVTFFHSIGIPLVHAGSLLRILGVSDEDASEYDDQYINIPALSNHNGTIH